MAETGASSTQAYGLLDRDALKARAAEFHARGFNCAQAVLCALAPSLGIDEDLAFRLMEGFGLGMGGMSETCGAISGAVAAVGAANSAGEANPVSKRATYQLSHEVVERFGAKNSSTICGELKGVGTGTGPLRSCPGCIDDAVDIAVDVLQKR